MNDLQVGMLVALIGLFHPDQVQRACYITQIDDAMHVHIEAATDFEEEAALECDFDNPDSTFETVVPAVRLRRIIDNAGQPIFKPYRKANNAQSNPGASR